MTAGRHDDRLGAQRSQTDWAVLGEIGSDLNDPSTVHLGGRNRIEAARALSMYHFNLYIFMFCRRDTRDESRCTRVPPSQTMYDTQMPPTFSELMIGRYHILSCKED